MTYDEAIEAAAQTLKRVDVANTTVEWKEMQVNKAHAYLAYARELREAKNW